MHSPTSPIAPWRVLVKGSSPANWISFMGGPPTDYTYPRVIERELLEGGRNVTVRNLAMTSERVKTGLKNWEGQVFSWSPDVVVLHYGLFEATRTVAMPQGWLMPRPHVESNAYAVAIERLRAHGVQVQRVVADAELMV